MTQPTPSDQLRLVMDAARSNPRSPDVWVNLGQALLWQNPPAQDRARECFNRALQLAPGHAAARQGLDALAQPTPSAPPASQPYTPLLFAAPPSTVAPMPVAPLATPVVAPVPPPSAVAPVPMTLPVPPTVAPAAINCSQCGCPIVGGTDFCLMCGTPVAPTKTQGGSPPLPPTPLPIPPQPQPAAPTVICPQCASLLPDGTRFCTVCGTRIPKSTGAPAPPKPPTAPTKTQGGSPPPSPAPLPIPAQPQPVAPTVICPQCASLLPDGTRFCTVCGTRIPKSTGAPAPPETAAPNHQTLTVTAINAFIEQMGNLDDAIAQQAAHQLSLAGPTIAPVLLDALGSGKGLFGTGKVAEQRRQWAIAALVEVGAPVIPDLIKVLGNDNKKQCEGATIALARIGAPAVAPLIGALPKLADNSYLPVALAKIGQPAVQPLAHFMRNTEAKTASWNTADMALCAIVGAPTRSEISALEQRSRISLWAFCIAGGLFFLVGASQSLQNGLLIGLFFGYLAWSVAWGGYIGWLGVIFSVIIAPFAALSHHLERKKKTKARLQFEATHLARTI